MKAYRPPKVMYMVIDTTVVADTKIRFVADLGRTGLLGRIYMAEHPGRKVITPPLERRGFAKLDQLALQYLVWNTFGETPKENYSELTEQAFNLTVSKIEPTETEIKLLESQWAGFEGQVEESSKPKAPKASKPATEPGASPETPKPTSTCGIVWALGDEMYAANGNQLPERAAFIARCEQEGIHPATASTQFAKWKKTKGVQPIS